MILKKKAVVKEYVACGGSSSSSSKSGCPCGGAGARKDDRAALDEFDL